MRWKVDVAVARRLRDEGRLGQSVPKEGTGCGCQEDGEEQAGNKLHSRRIYCCKAACAHGLEQKYCGQ